MSILYQQFNCPSDENKYILDFFNSKATPFMKEKNLTPPENTTGCSVSIVTCMVSERIEGYYKSDDFIKYERYGDREEYQPFNFDDITNKNNKYIVIRLNVDDIEKDGFMVFYDNIKIKGCHCYDIDCTEASSHSEDLWEIYTIYDEYYDQSDDESDNLTHIPNYKILLDKINETMISNPNIPVFVWNM